MRRWIILILTHLKVLAMDFAGSDYALPIFTAPRVRAPLALQTIPTETPYHASHQALR